MLEYASMRLRFFWARPIALPAIIDAIATPKIAGYHCQASVWKPSSHTRMKEANAAAFTVAAMNAVIADDDPSYTSGAHMWNGTAAILKPKPITSIARPTISTGLVERPSVATVTAIFGM